jgi:hypothetical protein
MVESGRKESGDQSLAVILCARKPAPSRVSITMERIEVQWKRGIK